MSLHRRYKSIFFEAMIAFSFKRWNMSHCKSDVTIRGVDRINVYWYNKFKCENQSG